MCANGAEGCAVATNGETVRLRECGGPSSSPESAAADLKEFANEGPTAGGPKVVVEAWKGDLVLGLDAGIGKVTVVPSQTFRELRACVNNMLFERGRQVRGKPGVVVGRGGRVCVATRGSICGGLERWGETRPGWEAGEILVVNVGQIVIAGGGFRNSESSADVSKLVADDANV